MEPPITLHRKYRHRQLTLPPDRANVNEGRRGVLPRRPSSCWGRAFARNERARYGRLQAALPWRQYESHVLRLVSGWENTEQLAEQHLPKDPDFRGVFLILVSREPGPVWEVVTFFLRRDRSAVPPAVAVCPLLLLPSDRPGLGARCHWRVQSSTLSRAHSPQRSRMGRAAGRPLWPHASKTRQLL